MSWPSDPRDPAGGDTGYSSDRTPTLPWPGADPRTQVLVEDRFFEPGATIPFDRLPSIPFWGPLFGMNETVRTAQIIHLTTQPFTVLKRKVTQPEIDALSEATAKNFNRSCWAFPLSWAGAVAWAYNGRKTFRFPAYTPKGTFNPHVFPHRRVTLCRGNAATWAWHATRTLAYAPLTRIFAVLFIGSISTTSMKAVVAGDPRLREVRDGIARYAAEASDLARKIEHGKRQNTEFRQQIEQRRQLLQSNEQPPSAGDQSPAITDGWQTQNPAPVTPSKQPITPVPPPKQPSRASDSQAQDSGQSSWDDSGLFDDDASPVSASARRAEQQQQQRGQGSQMGSSWDRIRQQAQTGAPGSRPGQGGGAQNTSSWDRVRQEERARYGPSPPKKDDYSYDEAAEAKSYAQSQAQKEFDEMLERERRGEGSSGWTK